MRFNGPRYGRDALPDRDGTEVEAVPCACITCTDMGAWLTERHFRVTFTADSVSMGHVPARWLIPSAA